MSKQDGGKEAVDNAILARRLCNRIDYSIRVRRSHARDLERIRKAREERGTALARVPLPPRSRCSGASFRRRVSDVASARGVGLVAVAVALGVGGDVLARVAPAGTRGLGVVHVDLVVRVAGEAEGPVDGPRVFGHAVPLVLVDPQPGARVQQVDHGEAAVTSVGDRRDLEAVGGRAAAHAAAEPGAGERDAGVRLTSAPNGESQERCGEGDAGTADHGVSQWAGVDVEALGATPRRAPGESPLPPSTSAGVGGDAGEAPSSRLREASACDLATDTRSAWAMALEGRHCRAPRW